MIHPLMTFSFILTCLATFFNVNVIRSPLTNIFFPPPRAFETAWAIAGYYLQNAIWLFLGSLIVLCTLAPWVSSVSTLRMEKLSIFQNLPSLLVLLLLGFGISVNNTLEAGKALMSNRVWEFARTPKYADLHDQSGWKKREYQIDLDPAWILELAFACIGILAIGMAIRHSNFFVLLILIPFTTAYTYVFFLTILQSRRNKVP